MTRRVVVTDDMGNATTGWATQTAAAMTYFLADDG